MHLRTLLLALPLLIAAASVQTGFMVPLLDAPSPDGKAKLVVSLQTPEGGTADATAAMHYRIRESATQDFQQVWTHGPAELLALKWHRSGQAVLVLERTSHGEELTLLSRQQGKWTGAPVKSPEDLPEGDAVLCDASSSGEIFTCYERIRGRGGAPSYLCTLEVNCATGLARRVSQRALKEGELPMRRSIGIGNVVSQIQGALRGGVDCSSTAKTVDEPLWYGTPDEEPPGMTLLDSASPDGKFRFVATAGKEGASDALPREFHLLDAAGKTVAELGGTDFSLEAVTWHRSSQALLVLEHISHQSVVSIFRLKEGKWSGKELALPKGFPDSFALTAADSGDDCFLLSYQGYSRDARQWRSYIVRASLASGETTLLSSRKFPESELPFQERQPGELSHAIRQMLARKHVGTIEFSTGSDDDEPKWFAPGPDGAGP